MKINKSWKSVLIWSCLLTIVLFILSLILNPNDDPFKGIGTFLGASFIGSLIVVSVIRLIAVEIKDFLHASKRGKIVMIIIFILVLIYVVPQAIDYINK